MERGSNYSPEHVRALIEGYQELKEKVDTTRRGLDYLVQMADLDRVLARLPRNYWEVVLLRGLLGLTLQDAGAALGITHQGVSKRYAYALEEITHQINHGGH